MQVLGENILVKLIRRETTDAGLIIPDTVKLDETVKGEVIGIGNGCPEWALREIKVGDTIVWVAYAGTWMKIENQTYGIIRPNDVVCKL